MVNEFNNYELLEKHGEMIEDEENIFIDFVKQKLKNEKINISLTKNFIKLYNYLKYDKFKDFVVNFNYVWKWLEFTTKDEAKDLLIKYFKEEEDYKIINNKEKIMLSVNTFNKFCLKVDNKNGEEIYNYYIKLEYIYFEYIINKTLIQAAQRNEKIIVKDYKHLKNVSGVYFMINPIIKLCEFGYSNDLEKRLKRQKSKYKDFYIDKLIESKKPIQLERIIRKYKTQRFFGHDSTEVIKYEHYNEIEKIYKDIEENNELLSYEESCDLEIKKLQLEMERIKLETKRIEKEKEIDNYRFVEIYQYLIDYPLPYEIINNEIIYDLFRKLVKTHDVDDLFNYIKHQMNLSCSIYNNGNIYYHELTTNGIKYIKLTKNDIIDKVRDTIVPYISKYINYYNLTTTETDFPKQYVLKNLYILLEKINNEVKDCNFINKITECFEKVDKYSPCTLHNDFLHKIIYDKSNESKYLKLKDLYTNYKNWYKQTYPEDKKLKNKINKNQLEKLVQEHIKNKNWSMNPEHNNQKINAKSIRCWKYIYFQQ
jgi:hypothetical protein